MSWSAIAPATLFFSVLLFATSEAASSWSESGLPVGPAGIDQFGPVVVADGSGGAFIVWEDARHDGWFRPIVQRLNAEGEIAPGWPADGLMAPPAAGGWPRDHPVASGDGSGGVFVADDGWDGGIGLYHFATDGSVAFTASTAPTTDAGHVSIEGARATPMDPEDSQKRPGNFLPTIAPDGVGGMFVAWWMVSMTQDRGYVSRVTAAGQAASGWPQAGLDLHQWAADRPVFCLDGAGGVFLLWTRTRSLRSQHVLGDGRLDPRWPAEGLDLYTSSEYRFAPGIVADGAGGFMAVWQDRAAGVFAQRVTADGATAPDWPAEGKLVCRHPAEAGIQQQVERRSIVPYHSVVSDGAGGAFIAWTDYRDSTGTGNGDIYALRVQHDGSDAPGWPEDGLAVAQMSGDQRLPVVASDGAGGVLIAWQDGRSGADYDVYAQHLGSEGEILGGWPVDGIAVCAAPGDQEIPAVTSDGAEGAIVAWVDRRDGTRRIYASRVGPDTPVPALAALEHVETASDLVRITWLLSGAAGSVVVFRTEEAEAWTSLTRLIPDGTGRVVFEDRDVLPGHRYGYRLGGESADSWLGPENWVDVPGAPGLALGTPYPQPVQGAFTIPFSLAEAEPAMIEIVDVAGRSLVRRDLDMGRAGRHEIRIDGSSSLTSGLYFVRLTQRGRSIARRVCVIR